MIRSAICSPAIRNAQQRAAAEGELPASKLRQRVLDVLIDEGYIRGYSRVDHKNGVSEFEIELKYANGQPAIREIKRVSKPAAASTRVSTISRTSQTAWVLLSCHAEGRDVGCEGRP